MKEAIDVWADAARISEGRILRSIHRGGELSGVSLSAQSIFEIVEIYAEQLGICLAPHDLRRTHAHLAHVGKAGLEQIQMALGHASIATTELYLGIRLDLEDAPCDHISIQPDTDEEGHRARLNDGRHCGPHVFSGYRDDLMQI